MKLRIALTAAIFLASAITTFAQPGALDTTYGDGGVSLAVGHGHRDMVIDAWGRAITLTARSDATTNWNWAWTTTRRLPSGALDPSFGSGGIATISGLGSGNNAQHNALQLAVQPDGRIIILGRVGSHTNMRFMLARLTASGSLDNTFTRHGFILSPSNLRAAAMTLLPDGKILVSAETDNRQTGLDFAFIRFNSNGSVDNSFGNKGVVVDAFTPNQDTPSWKGLFVQPDGRFVMSGFTVENHHLRYLIARYNANGTRDTTFGSPSTPGKMLIDISGGYDVIRAIAPAPGDAIVASLFLRPEPSCNQVSCSVNDLVAARFTSSGHLDSSFGGTGWVQLASPWREFSEAIVVQSDDTIILAGARADPSGFNTEESDLFVARLNADGTPDLAFGNTGEGAAWYTMPPYFTSAHAVRLDGHGRIVLSGSAREDTGPTEAIDAVWRMLSE